MQKCRMNKTPKSKSAKHLITGDVVNRYGHFLKIDRIITKKHILGFDVIEVWFGKDHSVSYAPNALVVCTA